jgi:Bacterial Ig-like domain (group 2)
MFACRRVLGLSLVCLVLSIAGCANTGLDSIQVTPAVQSLAIGQSAQFNVIGTYGNANHSTTQAVTTGLTWTSSSPSVADISSSGAATAVGPGTTTITASAAGFNGPATSSATLTVTGSGGVTIGQGALLSLTIIPSSITVGNLQDTGQFLAIGTFSSAPTVRDLTNSSALTWISSTPSVFPVNSNIAGTIGATAGIVTAYGSGNGVIIAEAKDSSGTVQTATANFSCPLVLPNPTATPPTSGTCYPGSQAPALLATLTVYNEGLNTNNWLVTAPSATGTPNVLECGPGAPTGNSVCVATYPVGTTVTLTAPAQTGVAFGGWSYNCAITAPITAAGPNSCTVTLTTNDTVGAIFN